MRVEVEMVRTVGKMTYSYLVVGEVTPTSDATVQVKVEMVFLDYKPIKLPVVIDEDFRHECMVELLRAYDEAKAAAGQFIAERYPHIREVA